MPPNFSQCHKYSLLKYHEQRWGQVSKFAFQQEKSQEADDKLVPRKCLNHSMDQVFSFLWRGAWNSSIRITSIRLQVQEYSKHLLTLLCSGHAETAHI